MPAPVLVAAGGMLVKWLTENGLNLLAGAVKTKGQEFVEEKLGVKLDDYVGTEQGRVTLAQIEAEREAELLEYQIKVKEIDLRLETVIQQGVTDRWKADMASDSWLSKNIRPMVLIFLLGAYSLFSIGSAFGININAAYVELLGQWGMLVMTAYFGGRTVEKVMSMKGGGR